MSAVHWAPPRRAIEDPPKVTVVPSSPGFYARRARGPAYWMVVEVLPYSDGTLWWVHGARDLPKHVEADHRYEWSDKPYAAMLRYGMRDRPSRPSRMTRHP